jgi:hypothetical protein
MLGRISTLALALAAVSVVAPAGGSAAGWGAKDISVVETVPGQKGSADTRLEVGSHGDARITVDMHDGDLRTKGTILLVGGRWMLTQGFTPKPGEEIDLMDEAALNSQLVVALLNAALPKGPPEAGLSRRVQFTEKTKPIQVATTSASGEYSPPWKVEGTVHVPAPAAPATYHLSFTFSAEGRPATLDLAGSIGTPDPPISFPDSMTLAGWTIHRIGPYQEQLPDGTNLDYGARPQSPKAATIGELRKLQ